MRQATVQISGRPLPPLSYDEIRCQALGNNASATITAPVARSTTADTCLRRRRKNSRLATAVASAASAPPRDSLATTPTQIAAIETARAHRPRALRIGTISAAASTPADTRPAARTLGSPAP